MKSSTPWKSDPAGPQVCVLVMSTCSAGAEKLRRIVEPSMTAGWVTLPTGTPPASKPWAVTTLVVATSPSAQ